MNTKTLIAYLVVLLSVKTSLYASENSHTPVKPKPPANMFETPKPKQKKSNANFSCKQAAKKNRVRIVGKPIPKDYTKVNFTEKNLPVDLRKANLTQANLSGCHFTVHNFNGAKMDGVILTGTTCDYVACFQDNVSENRIEGGIFYLKNIPKELGHIAQVYPAITEDRHKAALLMISSELAYLPDYNDAVEFFIKVEYCACKLFLLKEHLGALGRKLAGPLVMDLAYDADNCCWKTDYPIHLENQKGEKIASNWSRSSKAFTSLPVVLAKLIQHYITSPKRIPHDNFDKYLTFFQKKFSEYDIKSTDEWGKDFYKNTIKKNIKGLKKAYPKLKTQELKKEAREIASELVESYKKQEWALLYHFLSCQNRLIELKSSAGVDGGNDIFYNRNVL